MDDRDSIPGSEGIFSFSLPLRPDRLWRPPGLLSNGYPGGECDADHSPPSVAEVNNAFTCMAWCLIEQDIRLHGVILS
jgi:hypothetical protein